MDLLAKQDEREEQLLCMSRISSLEMKEKHAKEMGLENPLTEEEKEILSEYRKEYGITEDEDSEVEEVEEDSDSEEVGEEFDEVPKSVIKEKFKPKKIGEE